MKASLRSTVLILLLASGASLSIAQPPDLVDAVRTRQFTTLRTLLKNGADVNAACGLVENEHTGLGGEPLCEHHLLLVAPG